MGQFEEKLLTHCGFQIAYITSGKGAKTYLCFHGFGRSSRDYTNYIELLNDNARVIAVDMFFHGNSSYPEERIDKNPITNKELIELLSLLLEKENVDRFHLIGYSMGGRISQLLVEFMPERVDSLTLMAPDAIKNSPWYHFASRTSLGRMLYRSTLRNPGWLFGLIKVFRTLRLLPRSLAKFVRFQMETESKRRLVYNVWMALRKISPNLNNVKSSITQHNIPYLLIFGKYDRVIPPGLSDKFTRSIEEYGTSITIENGHNFIKPDIEKLVCKQIRETFGK